jgi:hypothetical protein
MLPLSLRDFCAVHESGCWPKCEVAQRGADVRCWRNCGLDTINGFAPLSVRAINRVWERLGMGAIKPDTMLAGAPSH